MPRRDLTAGEGVEGVMETVSEWIILRTSGRNTLGLLEDLTRAGFDVWTPVRVERKRAPRSNARYEIKQAMMSTYVFAKSHHVEDLCELAKMTQKDCPDFSVFHYLDRIPVVADRELDPLRMTEARMVPRKKARTFNSGELVRVQEGPFTGMTGMVEHGDGKYTLVLFGRTAVKIHTFLLRNERMAA